MFPARIRRPLGGFGLTLTQPPSPVKRINKRSFAREAPVAPEDFPDNCPAVAARDRLATSPPGCRAAYAIPPPRPRGNRASSAQYGLCSRSPDRRYHPTRSLQPRKLKVLRVSCAMPAPLTLFVRRTRAGLPRVGNAARAKVLGALLLQERSGSSAWPSTSAADFKRPRTDFKSPRRAKLKMTQYLRITKRARLQPCVFHVKLRRF